MKDNDQIQWRPWGAEAFEDARRSSKPIFLSISAVWCHWCHVMDQESFEHPEVIRRLNRDFVPVRVDSDRRPDINQRYNMGGWPTVAVLDPEGELITGGTYLPTGELLRMLSIDAGDRDTQKVRSASEKASDPPSEPPRLDDGMIRTVAEALRRSFDPEFGGFGGPPKFPQPWGLELALDLWQRTGDLSWRTVLGTTLDHLRGGEIYDAVDGGFFRYATRGDWDRPHYEKLLEPNARMALVYLRASHLTGEVPYRATARGIIDYLYTHLQSETDGWFYGSQTADAEYYALSEEERLPALPPDPDRTLFVDQNAVAASALLSASRALEVPKWREDGLNLLGYLWEAARQSEGMMFHYIDSAPAHPGFLADQVQMITALLDAHELTGEGRYLGMAQKLHHVIGGVLWDGEKGGYWDRPGNHPAEGFLKIRMKSFVENAISAIALIRLFHFTGEESYRRQSQETLSYLATVYLNFKHHAAPFAVALERWLFPPDRLVVVGRRGEAAWMELVEAGHRLRSVWRVIIPLDADEDRDRIRALGFHPSERAAGYFCVGSSCLAPVSSREELERVAADLRHP